MISVRVSWRVTLLSIPVIMVIIAVISIAPYLTDKDEHTALYKLNSNVYSKTMHSHCGGDSVLLEISLLILSPTSKMPVSVTTISIAPYLTEKDEHTALYKLSSNVYTKTMHSHCGGDSVLMEISLLILSPTSKMPVYVTTASAPTYLWTRWLF